MILIKKGEIVKYFDKKIIVTKDFYDFEHIFSGTVSLKEEEIGTHYSDWLIQML